MKIRHGIDIIRISRIERAIERSGQGFLDRIWTADEQTYCLNRQGQNMYQSLAARFAAKEAVAKALGIGLLRNGIALTSIDVRLDALGSPSVVLSEGAMARYKEIGGIDIAISLTHDGDLAQAGCVILAESLAGSDQAGEAINGEE